MRGRVPLLPLVIVAAFLLFGVKVGQLWQGIAPFVAATPALAQAAPPAEGESEEGASEEGSEEGQEGEAEAAPRPAPVSEAEFQILENLGARREALDARERQLVVQEAVLKAAEARIDEKIAALKQIEATIQALLKRHDEEEEKKLRSLVKIYEKMKPKQAAVIFNKLEMHILLDIAERMREAIMAPILAQMDSDRAKALSTQLYQRRKLPVSGG